MERAPIIGKAIKFMKSVTGVGSAQRPYVARLRQPSVWWFQTRPADKGGMLAPVMRRATPKRAKQRRKAERAMLRAVERKRNRIQAKRLQKWVNEESFTDKSLGISNEHCSPPTYPDSHRRTSGPSV